MRVFVTGASGTIGSAVVPELRSHGHEVLALARSDASAQALRAAGASVLRGDLSSAEALRAGATQAEGVIHLAFGHDFSAEGFARSIAEEQLAVETFGAALAGTNRPLVVATGTPIVPGRLATEADPPLTEGPLGGRGRNAQAVIALAARGVRSSVLRLPRSVHQAGKVSGFASALVSTARKTGVSGYVGDGTQRWPAVHQLDTARLARALLERAEPGTVAHAVGSEGDTMRSLAEAIGEKLGLPVESVPAERFGFLGQVFALDQPASSAWTRKTFAWEPTEPTLLDDLATGVLGIE